ncbi:MAG TPA: hypothetical protein VD713_04870, partial [Sphingomonadales bacterium]|nr:hypothetical protein [Sphingomonadales bacterium]
AEGSIRSRYAKDLSRPFDATAAEEERKMLRTRHGLDLAAALAYAGKESLAFSSGLPNALL